MNETAKKSNGSATERNFAAGEFIFEEGEIGNVAYVVVEGTVEICKTSGGELLVLQELKKDALFGEMAIIDKSPRSASARAATDAVVREVNDKALMAHIKKAPDVALNMMYRLASYVRTSNKNLESSVFESGPAVGKEGEDSLPTTSGEGREKYDRDIEEVINELPPHYKAITLLRHDQQLSYEEIAEVLSLPLGTVKARIHRARQQIQQMLAVRSYEI